MFTPIQVGPLKMKNRFVRSATHEFMADDQGFVTEKIEKIWEKLAENQVACLISGYAFVHPKGKSSEGQAAIYDDKFIVPYERLVKAAHAKGAKAVLQVAHGGRQSKPELCGGDPLCPSAVPDPQTGINPREIEEGEIVEVIDSFAEAIRRGRDAGFDAVELHAAHGYLLNQFLSPHTNRRTDKWGGSEENRFRILHEIIAASREKVGSDYPLWVKLNSEDFLETGLKVEDAVSIAKRLEQAGISAIEVSGGIMEAGPMTARTRILKEDREAYFLPAALRIKEVVGVPVIVVGGFRSASIIQQAIDRGVAMVSLSRPFIREPDLLKKFQDGKERADCISCNGCFNPEGIQCQYL